MCGESLKQYLVHGDLEQALSRRGVRLEDVPVRENKPDGNGQLGPESVPRVRLGTEESERGFKSRRHHSGELRIELTCVQLICPTEECRIRRHLEFISTHFWNKESRWGKRGTNFSA